jgi:hypothetical protein
VISTVTMLWLSRPIARNTSCIAGAWPRISGTWAATASVWPLVQAFFDGAADQVDRLGHVEGLGR